MNEAIASCQSLGSNFAIIDNDQYMAVAIEAVSQAANWSTGVIGSGALNRGHSDNNPAAALAADAADSAACAGTGQTCNATTIWHDQRRTMRLADGDYLWDLAGNLHEWTAYLMPNNSIKPYVLVDSGPTWTLRELDQVNAGFNFMALTELRPTNATLPLWDDGWDRNSGIGAYIGGDNGFGGALYRGGTYDNGITSGLFHAEISFGSGDQDEFIGFRCIELLP